MLHYLTPGVRVDGREKALLLVWAEQMNFCNLLKYRTELATHRICIWWEYALGLTLSPSATWHPICAPPRLLPAQLVSFACR